MKISKILLETILPIFIAALFPIGYFFVTEKLFPEPALESCENYAPSNTFYFIYALAVTIVSGVYQIVVAEKILKRNKNNFLLVLLNSIVFAVLFTGIFIVINLLRSKIEWEFFPVFFLALFIWGLFFNGIIKLWGKIFKCE